MSTGDSPIETSTAEATAPASSDPAPPAADQVEAAAPLPPPVKAAAAAAAPPDLPETTDPLEYLGATPLGPQIVEELEKTIASLNRGLAEREKKAGESPHALTADALRTFVKDQLEVIRRRNELSERLARLRSILDPTAPPLPAPPAVAEEIRQSAYRAYGAPAGPALRDLHANAAQHIRGRLVEVEANLRKTHVGANIVAWAPQHGPWRLGWTSHESHLSKAGELLKTRRNLTARLAALAGDAAKAVPGTVEAVKAAVDKAGGPDALVEGIRSAWLVDRRYFESDQDGPKLAALQARLASARLHLETLGPEADNPKPGTYAAIASQDASEASRLIDALKSQIDNRQRSALAELVARAIDGDEPARVAIVEAARRLPAAFAPGFSEDVHEAVYAGAAFEAMVAELSGAVEATG